MSHTKANVATSTSGPKTLGPDQPSDSSKIVWENYWRLIRMHLWPTGSDMIWFPSMWGLLMNAHRLGTAPRIVLAQAIVHAVAGTFVHNAGCIWNDICDRRFDRHVARPIAQGLVSVPAALLWLEIQIIGYIAAVSIWITLPSVTAITIIYPYAKRVTYWPQAVLGVCHATCPLTGWYAIGQNTEWSVVGSLMLAMICWTIHFDTVYACPDKRYDQRIGIYSTALLFGDYVRPVLSVFCASFVACLAFAGYANQQGPLFYVLSVGSAAIGSLWQLTTAADLEKDGTKLFRVCAYVD
ncbi:UbiA prenyltransferase family-domain-containing protein [Fomitopsis betulina]|nr:UbiA prenyltransferase family-domain-containing protein [Fomitopsis betulina]